MDLKDTVMRVRQYPFFNNTDSSEHILETYNYPSRQLIFRKAKC